MMSDSATPMAMDRRPLKTRGRAWAVALAAALARWGVSPNAISVASIFFAALAGAALAVHRLPPTLLLRALLLLASAGLLQLRLLCNMLDGMVAIEGGKRSSSGDLFNEVPDRIADALILVGAGYGIVQLPAAVELGWSSALLATLTAYIRALGKSLGTPACFCGPMAKPQRMATLTVACLAAAGAVAWRHGPWLIWAALVLVLAGSLLTVLRRLGLVARALEER